MPKRSNTFQDVVSLVHRHVAPDAEIEDSAMLKDRLTGELAEVDVVIRASIAGHQVVISIEALAEKRPATVEWTREMRSKHEHLPTHRLVLVSDSGFTEGARKHAEANGIVAVTPAELANDDSAHIVVGKIATLWPKTCSLTPTRVILHIRKPDGVLIDHEVPEINYQLHSAAGEPICDLGTAIHGSINTIFAVAVEELSRTAPPDGGTAEIDARADPWELEFDGRMQAPYVRVERTDPQIPIELWVIEQASFEVLVRVTPEAPLDLRHQDVAGSATAFGEMRVADYQGVLVITEGSSGARATFRARKDGEKNWRDIPVQPTAAFEDLNRSEPSTGAP